jgi:predicted nucleic acid-binding protein
VTLLLDTNAVVALVEHQHRAVAELVRESGEWPTISLITIGELLAGVAMASTPTIARLRRRSVRRTAQFRVHPVDRTSMTVYADVRRAGLRGNDALVVTAAAELDAHLVTFDQDLATKADPVVSVSLLAM